MASTRIKGITIEIGADTTKLSKAIEKFDKQITGATKNLRDINKLLKADPKNVELLTQKQQNLTEAIENTKKKLEDEKKALEQLKNGPQTEETRKQQELLTREIIDTEQSLKSLENEYKEFGSVAKQQTKAAGEAMKETGQKIQDVGAGLTKAGKTMTTYVTAPIVAAGTAAVKKAAEFEYSMSKVQALSGATADEMALLEQKAREMGQSTKFTASESAEALSYMAMAGWDVNDMLNGLDGIIHLAAAGDEDLAKTSDIVTDALTAFGLTAKDSSRFADILAAAAVNSNTDIAMMGESFKYAAAPAGLLGYTAEDTALALGLMADNGIKADMAGTSLRNIFQRMTKETKESGQIIERMGLSLYDTEGKMYSFRDLMLQMRTGFKDINMSAEDFDKALDDLDAKLEDGTLTQAKYDKEIEELTKQAFGAEQAERARAAAMLGGTRAMSGLIAIVQASPERFEELANAIDSSSEPMAKLADGSIIPLNEALEKGAEIIETYSGQAEKIAAIREDNLTGDITKLKADIDELAISLGKMLIPEIREFVASIKELVDKLNAMDESDKQAIINMAKFAAVIGPVLMIIGGLVTGVGKLVWAWGNIQTALAGSTVAVEGASAGLAGLGATISGLVLPIGLVVAAIAVWVKNWDQIKEASGLLKERLIEDWGYIKEAAAALKEYTVARFNEIKEDWRQKWELIKEVARAAWDIITTIFDQKTQFIQGIIDGGFGYIWDSIQTKMKGVYDTIVSIFTDIEGFVQGIIDKAKKWGEDMVNNIKSGIEAGKAGIKIGVEAVGNEIKSRWHFSEPDKGPLKDFNTWMPDMMQQMADQIKGGTPWVTSAIQGTAQGMRESIDYSGQLASINNGIGRLAMADSNITIPVYIGQNKFAQAVVNANQSNNYRSGGR